MQETKKLVPADFFRPLPPPNAALFPPREPEKSQPDESPEGQDPDAKPEEAAEVDSRGVAFDPQKHNGAKHPKHGFWMPKRGSKAGPKVEGGKAESGPERDAGPRSFIPDGDPEPDAEPDAEPDPEPAGKARRVGVNFNGKSATNLTHLAVLRVFGKDGRFTPEEHMVLEDCWNDVLAESSIELTPKKALAVTVVSIFAARLTQPCGEPALQRIFGFFGALADRIKAWWARRKVGSTARQAERFRQKREAAAEESG